MKFEQGFYEIKENRNKGIRLPEWTGFWVWGKGLADDDLCETIIMCCKNGEAMDLRSTKDVDFTIGNILREDWEVVELAPEFMIYPNFKDQGLGEELKYCWEM